MSPVAILVGETYVAGMLVAAYSALRYLRGRHEGEHEEETNVQAAFLCGYSGR